MLLRLTPLALIFLPLPILADQIACEGVFGIDTSEARFAEVYGRENVVTGMVPGPEGTDMLATTVFPDDPDKRFEVVWWNGEELKDMSYASIPAKDTAPGGLRIGMSIEEVEALNGEPFELYGFYWDNGGGGWFKSGKLAEIPGDCIISFSFHPTIQHPPDFDDEAITGDKTIRSDLPLLSRVKPVLEEILIGYPYTAFPHDY
jgi:hypothetical protein